MELRPGRVRQGHGRSWKRRAFTKNLREVGDVLFLRKVVPVWYPSIGARGRNTLLIARQTTRRPAVFAIPGLPHLAVFSVGIDGSVIHNSLLKQVVTGHGSLGDHDSSVIPSSECPVASGLAPSPATQPCPGRMTHQRAPQNPSDRNPLDRKAFNSNYTFGTGTENWPYPGWPAGSGHQPDRWKFAPGRWACWARWDHSAPPIWALRRCGSWRPSSLAALSPPGLN